MPRLIVPVTIPVPVILLIMILKQFSHFRVRHVSNACNPITLIADNLDIDGPCRVHVQRVESLARPDVQKDIDQLPLIVIILAVDCDPYRPVFRRLRFLPLFFPAFLQFVKFVLPVQRIEQHGLETPLFVL